MKQLKTAIALLIIASLVPTQATAYTVTKCKDAQGTVIVVDGHYCPTGWFRTW